MTAIAAGGASETPQNVPTVLAWGLVILALMLLTFGKVYIGHQRPAPAVQNS